MNTPRPKAILITRSRDARIQSLYRNIRRWPIWSRDVHFVGRLATYKYYNMDQIVAQALDPIRQDRGYEAQGGRRCNRAV